MKKQRKIVFWAASLLLTGALAAGGTLAYLTDKDSVTNQFVVGKVSKIKVKMILTSIWMFPYQSQK